MHERTAAPAMTADDQIVVWKSFLRAHAHVTRVLEAELLADHDLSLAEYDVLVQLSEAAEGRLRMTELAERVLLSRSGLTRLVDRMTRAGLVRREPCPDDARGTFTLMTDDGRAQLVAAAHSHLAGVDRHVVSRLSTDELVALRKMMDRLVEPALSPGGPD